LVLVGKGFGDVAGFDFLLVDFFDGVDLIGYGFVDGGF
jgi:hypothetical protein